MKNKKKEVKISMIIKIENKIAAHQKVHKNIMFQSKLKRLMNHLRVIRLMKMTINFTKRHR